MTIGYEGLTLDQFFELLRAGQVDTIVDVRQNPLSRKPGFSKTALSTAAQENGFEYIHLREFGCPKLIRDEYKTEKDWQCYTIRYLAYLATQEDALLNLVARARTSRCCLLCFEADPDTCHRSFVATQATLRDPEHLSVVHLVA